MKNLKMSLLAAALLAPGLVRADDTVTPPVKPADSTNVAAPTPKPTATPKKKKHHNNTSTNKNGSTSSTHKSGSTSSTPDKTEMPKTGSSNSGDMSTTPPAK